MISVGEPDEPLCWFHKGTRKQNADCAVEVKISIRQLKRINALL
jgi:hypothetical protein